MKLKNPVSLIAKLIAAGMLVGAVLRHPSYVPLYGRHHAQYDDYYTLLRWVVCGVAAFTAFQAEKSKKIGWMWALAIVALAFNPLLPVHLNRDTWGVIDLVVAALFIVSIVFLDRRTSPPTPPATKSPVE